jgi:hypothetical protein
MKKKRPARRGVLKKPLRKRIIIKNGMTFRGNPDPFPGKAGNH